MIKDIIAKLLTIKRFITIENVEISKWMPINSAASSTEKIVIKNDRGWLRICHCLMDGDRLRFYDHNEIEIVGFKPTYYMSLNDEVKDRDYAIAIAKHFNLTAEDLERG